MSSSPPKLVAEESSSSPKRKKRCLQLVVRRDLKQSDPVIFDTLHDCMTLSSELINQKPWIEIDLLRAGIDEGSIDSIYQKAIQNPQNSLFLSAPFGIQRNSKESFPSIAGKMIRAFKHYENSLTSHQLH